MLTFSVTEAEISPLLVYNLLSPTPVEECLTDEVTSILGINSSSATFIQVEFLYDSIEICAFDAPVASNRKEHTVGQGHLLNHLSIRSVIFTEHYGAKEE